MPSTVKEKIENKNGLAFIKEVAKYFMDFLETDFHKRKNPKRSIQLRSNNNLLIGLNLNKYPSFNNIVWKTINHAFDKNILNTIQKGVYRTNIPKNLLDLVYYHMKFVYVLKIVMIKKFIFTSQYFMSCSLKITEDVVRQFSPIT